MILTFSSSKRGRALLFCSSSFCVLSSCCFADGPALLLLMLFSFFLLYGMTIGFWPEFSGLPASGELSSRLATSTGFNNLLPLLVPWWSGREATERLFFSAFVVPDASATPWALTTCSSPSFSSCNSKRTSTCCFWPIVKLWPNRSTYTSGLVP